jgi:hypothetical protein
LPTPVELAFLGERGQVAAELLECLVRALRVLRRDALAAPDLLDLLLELVPRDDVEREQQVLGRDVLVLHAPGLVEGPVEDVTDRARDLRLLRAALDRRLRPQRRLRLRAQARRVGDELLRELLVEEREQQVLRVEFGVSHAARKLLRCCDRLLGFQGQFVEVHFRSGSCVGL